MKETSRSLRWLKQGSLEGCHNFCCNVPRSTDCKACDGNSMSPCSANLANQQLQMCAVSHQLLEEGFLCRLESVRRTPDLLCLIPAYQFHWSPSGNHWQIFLRNRWMSLPAWTPDAQTCILNNPFHSVQKLRNVIRCAAIGLITVKSYLIRYIVGRRTIHNMESRGRDPQKTLKHLFRYDPRCCVT